MGASEGFSSPKESIRERLREGLLQGLTSLNGARTDYCKGCFTVLCPGPQRGYCRGFVAGLRKGLSLKPPGFTEPLLQNPQYSNIEPLWLDRVLELSFMRLTGFWASGRQYGTVILV